MILMDVSQPGGNGPPVMRAVVHMAVLSSATGAAATVLLFAGGRFSASGFDGAMVWFFVS